MRPHWALIALLAAPIAAQARQPRHAVEVATGETVAFHAGGTIRIDESFGELHVEGWDRAEVEVRVVRRTNRRYESEDEWKAKQELERITVEVTRWGQDLHIVTRFPRPSIFRPLGGRTNLDMRYDIKAPRAANLRVRHSVGEVNVQGVAGDIDVTNNVGEVALRLPHDVEYDISARVKIGDVDSALPGRNRRTHLLGAAFDNDQRRATRSVYARVTVGQIRLGGWTSPAAQR